MTLGQLARTVFFICVGLAYLGVGIPSVVLGIAALIAGICELFGSVVVIGTRSSP